MQVKKAAEKRSGLACLMSKIWLVLFPRRAADQRLAWILITVFSEMDRGPVKSFRMRESKTVRTPFRQQNDKEHSAEKPAPGLPGLK